MLNNTLLMRIWKITLVLTVLLCLFTDRDVIVVFVYTGTSIGLFLADLWKNFTGLYRRSSVFRSIHAWNLFSSIGEVFFWSYLLFFIFVLGNRTFLFWFVMVDVFVVATYLNYTFSKKLAETEQVLNHG